MSVPKKTKANKLLANTVLIANYLVRGLNIPWLASFVDNITNKKLLTIVGG